MFGYAYEKISDGLNLIRTHKKKIALAAVIGGSYYAYKKVKPIIDEVRKSIELMESTMMQSNMTNKEQQQQMMEEKFTRSILVADTTLIDFIMHAIRPSIMATFDVAAARARLQKGRHNMQSWEQFKIEGLARTITTLYAVTLMNALVRIQFSIITRYDTLEQTASNQVGMNFMMLSRYLQTEGLRKLAAKVSNAIRDGTNGWELNSNCTFEDIQILITKIRSQIENNTETDDPSHRCCPHLINTSNALKWYDELFWPNSLNIANVASVILGAPKESLNNNSIELDEFTSQLFHFETTAATSHNHQANPNEHPNRVEITQLAEMLEETRHIVFTRDFNTILTQSLDDAFNLLLKELKPTFESRQISSSTASITSSSNTTPVTTTESTSTTTSSTVSSNQLEESPTVVVFGKAVIRLIKTFDSYLPEVLFTKDNSPLLKSTFENSDVEELCRIIFFPLNNDDDTNVQSNQSSGLGMLMDPRILEQLSAIDNIQR